MTHAALVQRAGRWLRNSRACKVVFTELHAAFPIECPDAIGWRSGGWSILLECKTSRADFLSDREKPFRKDGRGIGAERFYFALPGLIRREELPPGWGLLELRGNRVFTVLSQFKDDQRSRESILRELSLLSALLHRAAIQIHPKTLDEWVNGKAPSPRRGMEGVSEGT